MAKCTKPSEESLRLAAALILAEKQIPMTTSALLDVIRTRSRWPDESKKKMTAKLMKEAIRKGGVNGMNGLTYGGADADPLVSLYRWFYQGDYLFNTQALPLAIPSIGARSRRAVTQAVFAWIRATWPSLVAATLPVSESVFAITRPNWSFAVALPSIGWLYGPLVVRGVNYVLLASLDMNGGVLLRGYVRGDTLKASLDPEIDGRDVERIVVGFNCEVAGIDRAGLVKALDLTTDQRNEILADLGIKTGSWNRKATPNSETFVL